MIRKTTALAAFLSLIVIPSSFAQQHDHTAQDDHQAMNQSQSGGQGGVMQHDGQGGMMQSGGQGGMMDHERMMQMMQSMQGHGQSQPAASGQAGFTAIQEMVKKLEADPETDWSQVDIDALRAHLIDMDRVIMQAKVTRSELSNGMRYLVQGDADVADSIKRMVPTHARQMSSELDWSISTEEQASGVTLEVTAENANEIAKIRALGFSGFMVLGDHHQDHHLQMSTGSTHQH